MKEYPASSNPSNLSNRGNSSNRGHLSSLAVRKQPKQSRHSARRGMRGVLWFFALCFAVSIFVTSLFIKDFLFPIDSTKIALDESPKDIAASTSWNLILINKWNPVPDDYKVTLIELANGQLVDTRIYPALQEMFDAARRSGVYPIVVSGYRTAETQQRLFDEKMAEYQALGFSAAEAFAKAEAWVAVPGTSEHQLGIAVDINGDGVRSAGHEVYEWLAQNAYQYGFIYRYPPEKTQLTGVNGEPWHYRYVGTHAAAEIHAQGICLEEYLDSLLQSSLQ